MAMASPSPFDELLREFDDPPRASAPLEDPLRGENLQMLLTLSKKLEAIAKMLDPSEGKHPLHEQAVPEEARARLKMLVGELMRVQGELHEIEKNLLEEKSETEPPVASSERFNEFASSATALNDPLEQDSIPPLRSRRPLEERRTVQADQELAIPDATPVASSTLVDAMDANEPFITAMGDPIPVQKEIPAPAPPSPVPDAIPTSIAASSAPSLDHLELEKEKLAFETYKADWERVFAADPSQRALHPEVAAYYQQMEAYFSEKKAYLSDKHA